MSNFLFRYPGGKSKLGQKILPYFDKAISTTDFRYYEPFVGGGGMLLNVATTYPTNQLFINDLDENIYSFWKVVCERDDDTFEKLISKVLVLPTIELFNELRSKQPVTELEKAYYAFFFNKTTFSGMYDAGPIGGADQKGKWKIDCYYKPVKLANRMRSVRSLLKGRTYVFNLDFVYFLGVCNPENSLIYLDPPYFEKGKSLYPVFMKDDEHTQMSKILKTKNNWVLSYDNNAVIKELYKDCNIEEIDMTRHINVGNAKEDGTKACSVAKELVIYKSSV